VVPLVLRRPQARKAVHAAKDAAANDQADVEAGRSGRSAQAARCPGA
jgi:hypothetical protein